MCALKTLRYANCKTMLRHVQIESLELQNHCIGPKLLKEVTPSEEIVGIRFLLTQGVI